MKSINTSCVKILYYDSCYGYKQLLLHYQYFTFLVDQQGDYVRSGAKKQENTLIGAGIYGAYAYLLIAIRFIIVAGRYGRAVSPGLMIKG